MALTPEQIKKFDEAFSKASGIKPKEIASNQLPPIEQAFANLNTPEKQGFFERGAGFTQKSAEATQEASQDIKQTFQGVKGAISEAQDNIAEDINEFQTTDQGRSRGVLRVAGDTARGVGNVIGETVKGTAKLVAGGEKGEQKLQEAFGNVVGKGAEILTPAVEAFLNDTAIIGTDGKSVKEYWENLNPEIQQDVKDVLSLGELALEFEGLGVAKRGASTAKEVVEAGAKKFDETLKTISANTPKVEVPSLSGAKKNIGDIISPYTTSVKKQRDQRISRALQLSAPDLDRFEDTSKMFDTKPQTMPEFIAENNLIGDTAKETSDKIETFKNVSMQEVRNVISDIYKVYDIDDIPRYEKTIELMQKELLDKNNDVLFGSEDLFNQIDDLAKTEKPTLSDVQKAKELLDDVYDLYKKDGSAKSSRKANSLANVRKDIKDFIEKQVKIETGKDIAPVNRNVAKAFEVIETIQTRAGKSLTKSPVNIGDFTTFGATTGILAPVVGPFAPVAGVAGLFVKRMIENPTIRLKLAKALNNIEISRAEKILKEIEEEAISGETARFIKENLTE